MLTDNSSEPKAPESEAPPVSRRRLSWLRFSRLGVRPPERFFDDLIESLPSTLQPYARGSFTALYWLLFLDSAASLLTGRGIVREVAINAIAIAPPAVVVLLTRGWDGFLWLASLWQYVVQQPVRQFLSFIGIHLSAWQVDLIAVLFFSLSAAFRASRLRDQHERRILRAAKSAKQRPSDLFAIDAFRRLLRRHSGANLEADIEIISANIDRLLVSILRDVSVLTPFHRYQEAIINTGIILSRAFPSLGPDAAGGKFSRFDHEVYVPVMKGQRLTATQREVLLAGVDDAIPYLFTGDVGHVFFRYATTLFDGTTAQQKAHRSSRRQLMLVVCVTSFVLLVCLADLVISLR